MTPMSPTPSVHRVRPAGPPTLAAHQLRAAQAATLAAPRLRYDPFSRLLFFSVDLLYGRKDAPIGSPDPATTTSSPNRRRHSRHERLGDVRPPPTRGRPAIASGPARTRLDVGAAT